MDLHIATVVISAALGMTARVLVPYLVALRENPETKFDRKYIVPPLVSVLIGLITLPLVLGTLPAEVMDPESINLSVILLAFTAAWGTSDVIRQAQKLVE